MGRRAAEARIRIVDADEETPLGRRDTAERDSLGQPDSRSEDSEQCSRRRADSISQEELEESLADSAEQRRHRDGSGRSDTPGSRSRSSEGVDPLFATKAQLEFEDRKAKEAIIERNKSRVG